MSEEKARMLAKELFDDLVQTESIMRMGEEVLGRLLEGTTLQR